MPPTAERVQNTMFAQAGSERAAFARSYAQPAPLPKPTPDAAKPRESHKAANRIAALFAAVPACAAALVGSVFLYGHVQLAREAQRSVTVSEMLSQQVERSRLLANSQAKEVTPTYIGQKASQAGMLRPEEKDAIIVP